MSKRKPKRYNCSEGVKEACWRLPPAQQLYFVFTSNRATGLAEHVEMKKELADERAAEFGYIVRAGTFDKGKAVC